ncbi:MAG: hypothetical protein GXY52_05380 [Chloroflexi bacterium]|nr:hypothetical protein [Chloroflexota bacterium]
MRQIVPGTPEMLERFRQSTISNACDGVRLDEAHITCFALEDDAPVGVIGTHLRG